MKNRLVNPIDRTDDRGVFKNAGIEKRQCFAKVLSEYRIALTVICSSPIRYARMTRSEVERSGSGHHIDKPNPMWWAFIGGIIGFRALAPFLAGIVRRRNKANAGTTCGGSFPQLFVRIGFSRDN